MKKSILLSATFVALGASAHAAVVINNAGFDDTIESGNADTNPEGWTVFETTDGPNAGRQVRIRNNQGLSNNQGVQLGAGQSNHSGELYQTVATAIGQEYTFSIWAASALDAYSPSTQNFTIDLLAGTGAVGAPATGSSLIGHGLTTLTSVNDGGSLNTTFQEFTVNFTATSTDTTIWIQDTSAAVAADSNGMILDDVSIVAVPEPSTSALLGLGGLALILRRRK